MKRLTQIKQLILIIAVLLLLAGCAIDDSPEQFVPLPTSTPLPAPNPSNLPTLSLDELKNFTPEEPLPNSDVEVVVDGLDGPVAFDFAPDGRIFITEKNTGNVRVAIDGTLLPEPVLTLPVAILGEQGLIGIAIDPDFENNHHIWVTHVLPPEENNGEKLNRVVRFTEQDNKATDVQVAYTTPNIIETDRHNIGNLTFGPDGMLYIGFGEGTLDYLAPNLTDPRGKIMRFQPTVPLTAPEDNPFYDGDGTNVDGIFAYGFRNPFDITFDPISQQLLATENGPSCDDELNLVLSGYDYGWKNDYVCRNDRPADFTDGENSIPPLLSWTPTTAPTGLTVYTGDDFPEWYGDVFYCIFGNAQLHHAKMNDTRDGFVSHTTINGMFCQIDVVTGPDGALYFLEGGGFEPGRIKRLFRVDQ